MQKRRSLFILTIHQCFIRPPLPPEWTRFTANAVRVRSLTYTESASDVDEDVWGMVALYRPPSLLFPRLRKLEWFDNSDAFAFVNLLLGPTIIDLTIGRRYWDDGLSSVLSPVLSALPYHCPDLQQLRIIDSAVPMMLANGCADALINGLQKLTLYHADLIQIPCGAFEMLARRPRLTEAKVAVTTSCLPLAMAKLKGEALFPTAHCLHFHLVQLDESSAGLLRAMSSTVLCELALSATDPEKDVLIQHLQVLRDRKNAQKIQNLSLAFPRTRTSSSLPANRPEYTLDAKALELVYSFSNLLHLSITSAYLEVDDDMVTQFVKVFPRIKTLRLLSNYHTGSVPQVTVNGIFAISQGCREIEELGLAFDTSLVSSWILPEHAEWNESLHRFDVSDAPIGHPSSVALFITFLFSNLGLQVTADAGGMGENRGLRQQYATLWHEVQQQITWLTMARRQERARMDDRDRCGHGGARTEAAPVSGSEEGTDGEGVSSTRS